MEKSLCKFYLLEKIEYSNENKLDFLFFISWIFSLNFIWISLIGNTNIACIIFIFDYRFVSKIIMFQGTLQFNIVVTYSHFDSNIRVLYVFLGFLKNNWKYLKILYHRCLWVWAQLKLSLLSVLFIVFTYFMYSHFQILKYLKILLFEHLWKIRVFRMSLLCNSRMLLFLLQQIKYCQN